MEKNVQDLMSSAEDKQVNHRRTEGAIKAEHSMREAHHVVTRNEKNLEKSILFGKAPGSRGRSSIRWTDIIKMAIGSVTMTAKKGTGLQRTVHFVRSSMVVTTVTS